LLKRSKLQQARGRKKTDGPPGTCSLKGLFDGLTHFFTVSGDRKRSAPVYNPLLLKRQRLQERRESAKTVPSGPVASASSRPVHHSSSRPVHTSYTRPVNSCVVGSVPPIAYSSLSVRAPRNNTVMNVRPIKGHDSDCDADQEDEGEEEEERCYTGVKIRPGKEVEGLVSSETTSSSEEEEEERTGASQTGGLAGRVGSFAQDQGKKLVSLASFDCLWLVGLHSFSLPPLQLSMPPSQPLILHHSIHPAGPGSSWLSLESLSHLSSSLVYLSLLSFY
jgi:hypothetical protein